MLLYERVHKMMIKTVVEIKKVFKKIKDIKRGEGLGGGTMCVLRVGGSMRC